MDHSKRATLLKMYSSILRQRAKDDTFPKLTKSLVEHYSRKDLIHIINSKYEGSIPKEYELLEMENEDLLEIIGDDMYLISHTTAKWAKTQKKEVLEPKTLNTSLPKVEKPTTKNISKVSQVKNPKS